jgi:hypothetical protein
VVQAKQTEWPQSKRVGCAISSQHTRQEPDGAGSSMSSRCSSLSRASSSRALSPCAHSMHCVRPRAQIRVSGEHGQRTDNIHGGAAASRGQGSMITQSSLAPRIRRTCLACASEPTISRTFLRASARLPSAGSRVVQAVPDRGMQRGKTQRTLLHALSIARRWGSIVGRASRATHGRKGVGWRCCRTGSRR